MRVYATGGWTCLADYYTTVTVTGNWVKYEYTFNSGDNTSVWLLVQDGGLATIYYDDIVLEYVTASPSSPPSSPTPTP